MYLSRLPLFWNCHFTQHFKRQLDSTWSVFFSRSSSAITFSLNDIILRSRVVIEQSSCKHTSRRASHTFTFLMEDWAHGPSVPIYHSLSNPLLELCCELYLVHFRCHFHGSRAALATVIAVNVKVLECYIAGCK